MTWTGEKIRRRMCLDELYIETGRRRFKIDWMGKVRDIGRKDMEKNGQKSDDEKTGR